MQIATLKRHVWRVFFFRVIFFSLCANRHAFFTLFSHCKIKETHRLYTQHLHIKINKKKPKNSKRFENAHFITCETSNSTHRNNHPIEIGNATPIFPLSCTFSSKNDPIHTKKQIRIEIREKNRPSSNLPDRVAFAKRYTKAPIDRSPLFGPFLRFKSGFGFVRLLFFLVYFFASLFILFQGSIFGSAKRADSIVNGR